MYVCSFLNCVFKLLLPSYPNLWVTGLSIYLQSLDHLTWFDVPTHFFRYNNFQRAWHEIENSPPCDLFHCFFCFELILADCHLDTIFSLFQWNKWDGGTRRYSRTSFKRISAILPVIFLFHLCCLLWKRSFINDSLLFITFLTNLIHCHESTKKILVVIWMFKVMLHKKGSVVLHHHVL